MLTRLSANTASEMIGPISLIRNSLLKPATSYSVLRSETWGSHSPFQVTFVIRGIGYRATIITNEWDSDFIPVNSEVLATAQPFFCEYGDLDQPDSWSNIYGKEFPYQRYILIRAGHSVPSYIPIPNGLGVRVSKKDRKLSLYGSSVDQVSVFARSIFMLRPPSVYTGRGIRLKGLKPRRKLGKKDVRKGRYY